MLCKNGWLISLTVRKNEMEMPAINLNKNEDYSDEFMS